VPIVARESVGRWRGARTRCPARIFRVPGGISEATAGTLGLNPVLLGKGLERRGGGGGGLSSSAFACALRSKWDGDECGTQSRGRARRSHLGRTESPVAEATLRRSLARRCD